MRKWTLTDALCKRLVGKLAADEKPLIYRDVISAMRAEDVQRPAREFERLLLWCREHSPEMGVLLGMAAAREAWRVREVLYDVVNSQCRLMDAANERWDLEG